MIRSLLFVLAVGVAAPSLGCVGSAAVTADVTAAPRIVWIAPGVWVVEDYDRAVYYYDGFYWWHSAGIWHRSTYYTHGFVRVRIAPPYVINAYRPRRYIRYRAPQGARVRTLNKRRPKVRDNRSPSRPKKR